MSHEIRTPAGIPAKNRYTGEQFIAELTDSELEKMISKVKASDQVAAVWERIKTSGINCNNPDHLAILDKMVTATILTTQRRNELIG